MLMTHIFVSYKHEDSDDFVHKLEAILEEVGISVWTDQELMAGEDWRDEIDNAIHTSFALLVIMTPEARQSEYITYEWAYAWGIRKKIIPLMLRLTRMHPRLESLQYMDFTDARNYPWDALIYRLRQVEKQCLIEDLDHSHWDVRQRAVKRLADMGATEAIPELKKVAKRDRSKAVRATAREILEKLEGK